MKIAINRSRDTPLQDILIDNEVSKMKELTELWKSIPPSQLEIVIAMIQAVLKYNKD